MKKSRWFVLTLLAAALAAVAASSASGAPAAAAAAGGGGSCSSPTIGLATALTGPAAALGRQQRNWFRFGVQRWNASQQRDLRTVEGDTQLPRTAEAVRVARSFASNSNILAVVGLAGSQENVATTSILRRAGLGWVSASATRVDLTDGSRRGYFFRVVPNDAAQSRTVANYMLNTMSIGSGDTVVIVDDQESYGLGLSDAVERLLEARGVEVQRESVNPDPTANPDFSALAARVPGDARVVYVPWQIAQAAQTFGLQLREQGKNVPVFGSDGLFSPTEFKINGAFISFWGVVSDRATLNGFTSRYGGPQFFGAPSYPAVQVVASAIDRACRDGSVSRDEVRREIARTNLRTSIAGTPIRFTRNGDLTIQRFFVFKVVGGNYIVQR